MSNKLVEEVFSKVEKEQRIYEKVMKKVEECEKRTRILSNSLLIGAAIAAVGVFFYDRKHTYK